MTSMNKKSDSFQVPFISKIAYGMGDVGCNFSWMFVGNFLMIFYTDVFGIGMSAVASLMLFSRFWDAINDPIIGGLCDKTKNPMGKIPALAAVRSSHHGPYIDTHFLGTSTVERYFKDCVYGRHLLLACAWIYVCEHTLWNTLWGDDTAHGRKGTNRYFAFGQCNDCHWYH